jgi:hypothetical protein
MGVIKEFVSYMQNKCYYCGKKVKDKQGWQSVASFNIICDDCFDKGGK